MGFSSVLKANGFTESNLVFSVDGPAGWKGHQQMGSIPILARRGEKYEIQSVSLKNDKLKMMFTEALFPWLGKRKKKQDRGTQPSC